MRTSTGGLRLFLRKTAFCLLILSLIGTIFPAAGCQRRSAPTEVTTVDESEITAGEPTHFEAHGAITAYSTYDKGKTLTDSFYYSDAWFDEAPEVQNDALALLSMQLSAAAVINDENGYGADALRTIGCGRIGFERFKTQDPDDCAYTWATKPLGDGTLVVIIVQSYAFDAPTKVKGWKQNFAVNGDVASGEHAALSKAAEKVTDDIAKLGGEHVKYWITGQSRAGAIAGLIAAKLPEKPGVSGDIYAYTFESPATVDPALVQNDAGKYAYIHNYIASDDIVTRLPMWGMVRYGVDHALKTQATERALQEELSKIGSRAASVEVGSCEEKVTGLIQYLEARISEGTETGPERADYSEIRRDSFEDEEGNQIIMEYSYQEALVHWMGTIFSGELNGISFSSVLKNLNELTEAVYPLVDAVKAETADGPEAAAPYYRQAAQGVHRALDGMARGGRVSLTDTDIYALLRLIGPIAVNADYEPIGNNVIDVVKYIVPLTEWVESAEEMTYSHHFDTVIARLKTLASQSTQ